MIFDDFKVICFMSGIDPRIIEACRNFIDEEKDYYFKEFKKTFSAEHDLGYAELKDITTQSQSLEKIKKSIFMATFDFDILGRNLTKLRTKQLIKNPNKNLKRYVLKSFYLHYHNL